MHSPKIRTALGALTLVIGLGACGQSDGNTGVASSGSKATPEAKTTVVSYDGYPGDILTLSNTGSESHLVNYATYAQMRDFSETVVLGTLTSFEAESAPSEDGLLPGTTVARFHVDSIVGGRSQPMTDDGGNVTVVQRLDGDATVTDRVIGRLEPMYGKAQYLLFLNRATPGPNGEVDRYALLTDSGPRGVLAAWPDDGRFAPVHGLNDLAEGAIARGEDRTGTTDAPFEPAPPVFDGEAPVGLNAEQIGRDFARDVGNVETDPPSGWEQYLKLLDRLFPKGG